VCARVKVNWKHSPDEGFASPCLLGGKEKKGRAQKFLSWRGMLRVRGLEIACLGAMQHSICHTAREGAVTCSQAK